jgi:hypothetical protein
MLPRKEKEGASENNCEKADNFGEVGADHGPVIGEVQTLDHPGNFF